MILKSHLCGIAVAFDRYEGIEPDPMQADLNELRRSLKSVVENTRPQGSLYSWQKRKIADACEYMRTNPVHKPIIFVATSPGFTDLASERSLIKKFTHNLKNGYGAKHYVWVREFTGAGYPHFHFVADMPPFDPVKLSLSWSGYFGTDAKNSIRLGSRPDKNGKRVYYLTGKRHAWYLTKYLAKAIGKEERGGIKARGNSFRTFAVTPELARLSAPVEYTSKMVRVSERQVMVSSGKYEPYYTDERMWQNDTTAYTDDQIKAMWKWQYTGFANTHKGFPKEWKLRKKEPIIVTTKPEIECPF